MKLSTTLTMLLFSGALASAACVVENVDTDNTGGGGSDPTTSGTGGDASGGGGTGGDASGGGGMGGDGGAGGMSEGGGGEGGGGDACLDACDAMHPNGVDDYLDYLSCAVCAACYDACDGDNNCSSGAEAGCSIDAPDCETCINSTCTTDTVCPTEWQAFSNNAEAVALSDCYNACP